jgi:hypothetical protein
VTFHQKDDRIFADSRIRKIRGNGTRRPFVQLLKPFLEILPNTIDCLSAEDETMWRVVALDGVDDDLRHTPRITPL